MSPPTDDRTPQQRMQALRESLQLAGELADALTVQAARVKEHCRQLEDALADADASVLAPPPVAAVVDEAPAPAPDVRREAVGADPARMAAMEMRLAGGTREEVERYLRDTLEAENAEEILGLLFEQNGST